jgi:2-dehydro-3-deoxy-D-gluconate 5-dehydrogenase
MPNVLELFSLANRTALITGATRGIGQSLALALAEAGADVILIQRPGSQNNETKQKIEALGRRCTVYHADLAKSEDVKGLVKRITVDDGHDVSILVNNGGIQRRCRAEEFSDGDWDEVRLPSTFLRLRSQSS